MIRHRLKRVRQGSSSHARTFQPASPPWILTIASAPRSWRYVDPDHQIHVSTRLREDTDGELLASLKELDGARIRLPDDPRDRPEHAYLEYRFRQFRERR